MTGAGVAEVIPLELILMGEADSRPVCQSRSGCTNEALWHFVWQHPCPCDWWMVCQRHKELHDSWGIKGEYKCGKCGQLIGEFVRWERA